MKGFIRVWGGKFECTNRCEVDSRGNLCGGPEFPSQAEVEESIQQGDTSGETSDGTRWEYSLRT